MRIGSDVPLSKLEPASTSEAVRTRSREKQPEFAEQQDSVSFGGDAVRVLASDLQRASEPDMARVEALRQTIRTGQYRVEPEKVAASMLRELL